MNTNIEDIMLQAKKLQEHMKKAQEELKNITVRGESGAGLVKVLMNGKNYINSVEIDNSLLAEKKEILEDLVMSALNDAVCKVEEKKPENMSDLSQHYNLPKDFKFPL